jgi:DNA-binding NarL/FixJ family response regulator
MLLTIVLANEFELVRQGVRSVLKSESELQVIGECSSQAELLNLVSSKSPHLAIIDLPMTDLDIFEVMSEITSRGLQTRVLVLSGYPEKTYLQRLLSAGVGGYLLRTGPSAELIDAIRSCSSSAPYLSPSLAPPLVNSEHEVDTNANQEPELSPRQLAVLRLIAHGLSSKEIAAQLGIAESTVKTHRKSIMERLKIHDKVSLTRYAFRIGLIGAQEKTL